MKLLLTFIYLFFVSALHCKIKSYMRKKKQRRKNVIMSVQTRMKECNDPMYKKITRHIIFKLILIKYHSTHVILYFASTMWSFKMSNFIDFNFIYWTKYILFKNQNSSYLTIFMHIYMCFGQHLNGRLICFQTGYIYQVKVCLRTYPIWSCASF